MLKTLRAAWPRGAAHGSTAQSGLRDLLGVPAPRLREPDLPGRDGRARSRATRSTAATTRSARSRSTTARQALGYLIAEAERPGRFDVARRRRARRPARAGARRAPARRGGRARERERPSRPSRCSARRGPGRSLALTGDTAPAASVVEAAAGVDLLVHEATFCADERERARETSHSTAAEAALAAPGGRRAAARADAPLEPLLRLRGRRGGAPGVPRHRRAARLRRDRDPVSRSAASPCSCPAAPGAAARPATPVSQRRERGRRTRLRRPRPRLRHAATDRRRLVGARSPRWSSSVTSAAGACSTSAAGRGGSPPRSPARRTRRCGASTRATRWSPWRARRVPAGVGVRRGEAERLPFRDGWFDRVTMSLVLHLVDRPQALAEARRVVPDDGRIAISTFHPDHFDDLLAAAVLPVDQRPSTTRDSRRPTRCERELAAAGFPAVRDDAG